MSPGPTPPSSLRGPRYPTIGGRADGGGFLQQYAQLLNPRNSMSITNTKGLLNMPGQNNCFLNSAVQVLWHLDIFRRSFRELCGHACMEDSCIFCALKELFAQFQYSQESALPPDALRRALAETFCDQRRFQLGFMDDAAECFENILMRIHFHIANNESEDMCSAAHCIPHQKFAMTLVEQTVCHSCGATSEPLPFTQMVHYVPSSALCSQAKLMKEKNEPFPNFSELLKRAGGLGDLRDCPSSCGAVIQIRKTLMNRPEIVSVGLVWDSERPTIDHIMDVFKTIGMSLKLQDVFHSVVDSRWASSATHQLVGIVTYYGKHYSTFFFHTKLRVWIYFDDAAVREIGPKWEQVVEKCCKGHFQPLLLLYANPHGIPVNTSTAPRIVNVVPGHKKHLNGKDVCQLGLGHDKYTRSVGNQRRALTPNPEVTNDMNANMQPRRAVTPSGEVTWWDENGKEPENNPSASCHPRHNNNGTIKDRLFGSNSNETFPKQQRISDQKFSTSDASSLLKSRLAARLSVPNYPYFPQQPKLGSDTSSQCSQPTPKTSTSSDSDFHCQQLLDSPEPSIDGTYISRQTVETVLQLQKLQRQRSMYAKAGNPFTGQRNSSSSLESLDNVFLRDKGLPAHLNLKFDIPDGANVARRRDSGNWSGDRNSASSSSTTSLDNPYFYVVGNKRFPNGVRGRPGDTPSLTDPGYDSFSLSSSDSYPSAINSSPGKLGQIPEHVQTAFVPYDVSQLQYCLKDIKTNEHFPFGFKDECDKLCAEADIFVAKSIERENVGDISMAALLSDTAAARARAAMDVPYTNSQALAMAKMKHSMCLIRSSNLHKKLKEAEVALRKRHRELASELSRKEIMTPTNNKGVSESTSSPVKETTESTSEEATKMQKRNGAKPGDEQSGEEKNIEIYATLPKRSLKKKGALSSFVESMTGDESSEEKSGRDTKKSPTKKSPDISLSDREDKSPKSPSGKKKSHSTSKLLNRDSDLSDYSSEWEHTKKSSLYRTYSGPTSHPKNELGDLSSGSGQTTLSDHPTKKQHRIRRKLMGGFMRRKNRSLPDLREGQDSGGETTRSFDDCFFAQTPVACRRQRHDDSTMERTNPTSPASSSKKVDLRAHTPPPYKPPPSISPMLSSPTKRSPHMVRDDKTGMQRHLVVSSPSVESGMRPKGIHHPLLSRDSKGACRKLSAAQHPDFVSGSAVWLKELQLKQEEINRKKKLQEERERWITECGAGTDAKMVGLMNRIEGGRDTSQQIHIAPRDVHSTQGHLKQAAISNRLNSLSSEADQQKSVRDLTTKFEKISFPLPAGSDSAVEERPPHFPLPHPTEMHKTNPPSSDHFALPLNEVDGPKLSASGSFPFAVQSPDKPKTACDMKDKPLVPQMAYSTQTTSGSLYNPHLTDAQLTNVLRIGGNRSSFRNSSSDCSDSNLSHPREVHSPHEIRRPDKPPDYETALQRLELFRNDARNFAKLCPNSLSFEAILEQAKKRRGPKKSVTFSDKVVLVACAGDEDNDFIPNPLLERVYKQHFMQNPCSDASSVTSSESCPRSPESPSVSDPKVSESPKQPPQCNLCHKKPVEALKLYCPDCAYYMSRFQQK